MLTFTYHKKQPKIEGYNPEAASRKTNVSLRWHKKSTVEVSYTYSDLQHDLVFQDTVIHKTGLDTLWKINSDYTSQAMLFAELPITDKFAMVLNGQLDKNANNLQNFNDAAKVHAGEHRQIGKASIQFKPTIFDTIGLSTQFTRHETRRYNDKTTLVHRNQTLLSYSLLSPHDHFKIGTSAGFSAVTAGDTQQFFPDITGSSEISVGCFTLGGWGSYAIAPILIPYDTLLSISTDSLGDLFGGGGVDLAFEKPVFRFNIGYLIG